MKPLGLIIITYNRAADTLALLENIVQLSGAQQLLKEIIVVNNHSTEDYDTVKNYIQDHPGFPFKYNMLPSNVGVAKGRNYGIAKSTAPLLIFIDDDAVFGNKDCLPAIIKEFEKQDTDRTKAVISFKVLYFDTLQMQKNALPHKKYPVYKDRDFFETYYYTGCAHAVKREVFKVTGDYPPDFFYGMEEYDLSYRILDAGYSIVYSTCATILHKESPLGRKPKNEKIRMMWVNKSKVAWRYLPKKDFYSTALMWSLQYLKETKLDIGGFINGWKQILLIRSTEKRVPLQPSTMRYLKKCQARLWY